MISIGTYADEDLLKVVKVVKDVKDSFCKHASAVFSHKDQMSVHVENAVSTASNVVDASP